MDNKIYKSENATENRVNLYILSLLFSFNTVYKIKSLVLILPWEQNFLIYLAWVEESKKRKLVCWCEETEISQKLTNWSNESPNKGLGCWFIVFLEGDHSQTWDGKMRSEKSFGPFTLLPLTILIQPDKKSVWLIFLNSRHNIRLQSIWVYIFHRFNELSLYKHFQTV